MKAAITTYLRRHGNVTRWIRFDPLEPPLKLRNSFLGRTVNLRTIAGFDEFLHILSIEEGES
jgi:hypothetical protein